jgi:hypothetical protein
MKTILSLILIITMTATYSQVTKMIQVKNQSFQMNGVQDGEPVEKKTNVFGLTVNYETGEINGVVNLAELDLLNKHREPSANPEEDALKIHGFLPLNDILYNKQEQRQYTVELELRIGEQIVNAIFNFNIGYIRNTQMQFHDVRAMTTVNLPDFKVDDLNGFEAQVNIILMFQMLNLEQ